MSRSTLHSLNKPGSRVPSFVTLAKFDELLSWVPGSAHAVLYGKEPVTREYAAANPETALDEGALDSIYFEMAKDDQSAYHYDELKRLVGSGWPSWGSASSGSPRSAARADRPWQL